MISLVKLLIVAALAQTAAAVWRCVSDAECASLSGGECRDGACACPRGQQPVAGGTVCAPAAPYYWSACEEDFQCDRLATGYICAPADDGNVCRCRDGHHYWLGRCWLSRAHGEPCATDHECWALPEPGALACAGGVCACAADYYLRQRGECRRIGYGVGDGCVLDEDCQFPNGACDYWQLACYDTTDVAMASNSTQRDLALASALEQPEGSPVHEARALAASCDQDDDCGGFLACSHGLCVCPSGYYSEDDVTCIAELGSPPTEEAPCGGLFSLAGDICTCPANFYYEHHMRDCIKATQRFADACTSDESCLTFGAAGACGEPQLPWGLRQCECRPELAVLDLERQMCRLYSALGETCEVESDCLAGELQVPCVADEEGVRRCSCPEGLEQDGGLCLTRGLGLGSACQTTAECDGALHAECAGGQCVCAASYVQLSDVCLPALGGGCSVDSDCVIDNTSCQNIEEIWSCQCQEEFAEYNQTCYREASGVGAACDVRAQCTGALGSGADCVDGQCTCLTTHHHRNDFCWPITGLFERCSRTAECYLGQNSERVVCRNDMCQCDFAFPYSADGDTCAESSGYRTTLWHSLVVASAILSVAQYIIS